MDDIPEAIRESIEVREQSKSPLPLIIGGVFGLGIIGLLSIFLSFSSAKSSINLVRKPIPKPVTSTAPANPEVIPKVSEPVTPTAPANPEVIPETPEIAPNRTNPNKTNNILGHLPYDESSDSELTAITADGRIRLRHSAAAKFQQMQAAAKAEGIDLVALSGFRSTAEQDHLFFGIKELRVQDTTKRAEVSAPPGYSEHHTGYAIDIGDARAPETYLEVEFENTAAFRWLEQNAARYSFELSFPPDNPQGISYEPWHWRFVGDRDSLETFYKKND